MFVGQRWKTNLRINCQISRKINVHIYITFCVSLNEGKNCKVFPGFPGAPDAPSIFRANQEATTGGVL